MAGGDLKKEDKTVYDNRKSFSFVRQHLQKAYNKLLYRLFGLYRGKVILCRELVPMVSLNDLYESLEAEKISQKLKEKQEEFDKLEARNNELVFELESFQKVIDRETYDLMLKIIELQRKLNPEMDLNDLKEHFERVESGNSKIDKPKKKTKNTDKKLKKLYRYLANIYHPDKAPKGKEEEYSEIFKQITAFRDSGDYKGLKLYAGKVKKSIFKGKPNIKALSKMLKDITERVNILYDNISNIKNSDLYMDYLSYQKRPDMLIKEKRDSLRMTIHSLQRELEMRDSLIYGRRKTSRTMYGL